MVDIKQLARDGENLTLDPDAPYLVAYPHLVSYFEGLDEIGVRELTIGAHMVYGWMPTMVDVRGTGEERGAAAAALSRARNGLRLERSELETLRNVVNNSIVGVSKLLHFVSPEHYAIWDSVVYQYLHDDTAYDYRVNNVANYLAYLETCRGLIAEREFWKVHDSVNARLPYPVSAMRAVEMVMYETMRPKPEG